MTLLAPVLRLLFLALASASELRLGFLYVQSPSSWCQESWSQFKLAVQEVNADPGLLPNHNLTYALADTEGMEMKALEGAVSLLQSRRVHAVVGTGYSSALEATAVYCSVARVPIVSPGSSSIELTNKRRYPYLLRTVSNDASFLKAAAVTIREMGWRKAATLTNTDFEQGAIQVLHPSLKSLGVEYLILAYGAIDTAPGEQDLNNTLALITRAGFRVVFLYARTVDMPVMDTLTRAAGLRTDAYSWIVLQGAFEPPWTSATQVFAVKASQDTLGTGNPVRSAFLARWRNVSTLYNESVHGAWDPVSKMPFYGSNINTSVVWDTDYASVGDGRPDVWGMIVYDTVWVLAKAFHALLQAGGDPADGPLLREKLLAVQHLGVTGSMVFDQGTQDMQVRLQVVMTNGTRPHVLVGTTTGLLGEGQPGNGSWCLRGCLNLTVSQLSELPWPSGRVPSDGRALDASRSEATVGDVLVEGARVEVQFSARDSFGRPPCLDTCAASENSTLCQVCLQDLAAYHLLELEARDLAGELVAPAQRAPPPSVDAASGRGTLVLPLGFAGAGLEDRQLHLLLRHRGRVVPFTRQGAKRVTLRSLACREGQAGSPGSCAACVPGSAAPRRGMAACVACGPGEYQDLVGQASCKNCSAGRFSDVSGLSECLACPFGRYQREPGREGCQLCPSPMTTLTPGSDSIDGCVCPADMYRPSGTTVQEGHASGPCKACPPGMQCPAGSDALNFPGGPGRAASAAFPQVLPSHWSSRGDPISVYKCKEGPRQCPGGPPESCGPRLIELTCSKCEVGYYRQGDSCMRCHSDAAGKLLFPTLPILLSFVVIVPYYKLALGRHNEASWNTGWKSMQHTLALAVANMQVAGILVTCNLDTKPQSSGAAWPYINDVLALLHMECSGLRSLASQIVVKLLLPAWCIFAFVAVGGLSVLLARANAYFRMDLDTLWGCVGAAFMVFYITTCAISFALFKCYDHPNGEQSLQSAAQILCYREEWHQMVAVACCAVVVYCGGSLALFAWVLYRAPALRDDPAFAKRWRFLLAKFRPGCRWWTIPWLAKGLALNLAQVVFTRGQDQLLLLQVTIMAYLVATVYCRPWRHVDVNITDAAVHLALAAACGLLYWFATPSGDDAGRRYLLDILIACPLLIAFVFILSRALNKAAEYFLNPARLSVPEILAAPCEQPPGPPHVGDPCDSASNASKQSKHSGSRLQKALSMAEHITGVHAIVDASRHETRLRTQARFGAFARLSPEESQQVVEQMAEEDQRTLLAVNKLLAGVKVEEVSRSPHLRPPVAEDLSAWGWRRPPETTPGEEKAPEGDADVLS